MFGWPWGKKEKPGETLEQAAQVAAMAPMIFGGDTKVCGLVHLMLVVSGKPVTKEGQKKLADHFEQCRHCSAPGAFEGDLGACIALTEKIRNDIEAVFGPCEFLP